jgi:hypothetical protein
VTRSPPPHRLDHMAAGCDDSRATGNPGEGTSGRQVGHLPYRHREAGLPDPGPGTHPQRSWVQPFDAGHAPSPVRPLLDIGVDSKDVLDAVGNVNGGLESHATTVRAVVHRRRRQADHAARPELNGSLPPVSLSKAQQEARAAGLRADQQLLRRTLDNPGVPSRQPPSQPPHCSQPAAAHPGGRRSGLAPIGRGVYVRDRQRLP